MGWTQVPPEDKLINDAGMNILIIQSFRHKSRLCCSRLVLVTVFLMYPMITQMKGQTLVNVKDQILDEVFHFQCQLNKELEYEIQK